MRVEIRRAGDIDAQWSLALKAQDLAQAINRAVITNMEIYVAGEGTLARPAYVGLEKALDQVKRLRADFLDALVARGDDDGARQLALRLDDFLSYQADTAELGLKMPPRAALIQATDEATVRNRDDTLRRRIARRRRSPTGGRSRVRAQRAAAGAYGAPRGANDKPPGRHSTFRRRGSPRLDSGAVPIFGRSARFGTKAPFIDDVALSRRRRAGLSRRRRLRYVPTRRPRTDFYDDIRG